MRLSSCISLDLLYIHKGDEPSENLYTRTGITALNRVNLNHKPPCSGSVLAKQVRVAEEREREREREVTLGQLHTTYAIPTVVLLTVVWPGASNHNGCP